MNNANFYQTILAVSLGFIFSLILEQVKKSRERKETLKALLILTYAKIQSILDILCLYLDVQTKYQDGKYFIPSTITVHSLPTLGLSSHQIENLFVLSKNEKLILFIVRMEAFSSVYTTVSTKINRYELDSLELKGVIHDCEQCLLNIEKFFLEKFNESMYKYMGYKSRDDNNRKIINYSIITDNSNPN